jgi:hypothetical protein
VFGFFILFIWEHVGKHIPKIQKFIKVPHPHPQIGEKNGLVIHIGSPHFKSQEIFLYWSWVQVFKALDL